MISVTEEFANEVLETVADFLAKATVPLKQVHSFTGKVSPMAGVVVRPRWVANILYVVVATVDRELANTVANSAKSYLVATKRFRPPLLGPVVATVDRELANTVANSVKSYSVATKRFRLPLLGQRHGGMAGRKGISVHCR